MVQKQKAAGFHVLTDGEFRRETWHLDFMWGFKGIAHQATKTGLPFHGEAAMIDDTYLVGKLAYQHHPFVDHFKFVQALEDENTVVKQNNSCTGTILRTIYDAFCLGKYLEILCFRRRFQS